MGHKKYQKNILKTKKEQTAENGKTPKPGDEVKVLYQKLGNKWYAFSVVNEDVYMGELDSNAVPKKSVIKGGQA